MAKFSDDDYYAIRDWVLNGDVCVRKQLTYRFQQTYPKTFCLVWVRPQIPRFLGHGSWCGAWAALDVHYRSNDQFEALGGFWISGIKNTEVKPQQEFWRDGGSASQDAYRALRGMVPATAPVIAGHLTYDTFLTSLRAHDAVMQQLATA